MAPDTATLFRELLEVAFPVLTENPLTVGLYSLIMSTERKDNIAIFTCPQATLQYWHHVGGKWEGQSIQSQLQTNAMLASGDSQRSFVCNVANSTTGLGMRLAAE